MALTYQVVITPDAQHRIQEITEYLIEEVSVETATKDRVPNNCPFYLVLFPPGVVAPQSQNPSYASSSRLAW